MYTPTINKPTCLTVSQITQYIKSTIESDPRLMTVFVTGEISGMRGFKPNGHNYFVLKDSGAVLSATLFAGFARSLKFQPADGMKVICRGRIELYPPHGKYQIIIEDMQPDGVGALNLAFEQLKKKLEAQGLFDPAHKKPIPRFPRVIGVITSPTGAAFQDIKNILYRRFPCIDVILYPTLVQGDSAAPQLTQAVRELDESALCDTIIIGRGGGSIEDLWAFNDEQLARAVYECKTPVISAVGHEIDFTICDFVADLRAPTPSAAAEIAVPDRAELKTQYNALHKNINALVKQRYDNCSKRLKDTQRMLEALSPQKSFDRYEGIFALCETRMRNAMEMKLAECENRVRATASKLESLNPLSVLARGYAVAEKDGAVITSKTQLKKGDEFTLTLTDGSVTAVVSKD
ncbi:MAG: exodeoxyribonuclease VII large subunit [Ruminococcus sp.]